MDVINRDELERKLARVVGRDLRLELQKLLGYMGDPPQLENVPRDYWQNGWRDIQKDVEPALLETYLSQAEGLMVEIGVGVNWDQVNLQASRWARQHTDDILNEMWRARHDMLEDVINRYPGVGEGVGQLFEESLTIRELKERLEPMYGPVRAEMIAVTETTRAAVEGEREIIEQLFRESGIRMRPIWQTANDELVCPLCGPRHEKEITDGVYPPLHPRCRCGVGYELPEAQS